MNPVVGLLGLIFFCQCIRFTTSIKTDLGIPGTTQTISGKESGVYLAILVCTCLSHTDTNRFFVASFPFDATSNLLMPL